MQKFDEPLVNQLTGLPMAGISVTVQNYPSGTNATIYATNDSTLTPLTQPRLSQANGTFPFYAADGHYQIVASPPGGNAVITDILLQDLTAASAISVAAQIHAAVAKTTLANGDKFGIADSEAGYGLKYVIWSNIRDPILALFSAISGSSLIAFLQSGTGGVADTAEGQLKQWVNIRQFMSLAQRVDVATAGKAVDCQSAVQAAVNYCLANNYDLYNPYKYLLLSSTVNVDRQVDGAAYDSYFTIHGGGFYVASAIDLFSSTIAFTTAPVSQLVRFNGVNFEASDPLLDAYVLQPGRFLRTRFDTCNFVKIKCENSTIYKQSIYFSGCNMRRGNGTFFKSVGTTPDFKFLNANIVEAWTGDFLNLEQPIGGAIIGNVLEGITGTAIVYNGAQGFVVDANYFEANGLDIDGTGANTAYSVNLKGNFFAHTNPAEYSVIWGTTVVECVSVGNYHNGSMHSLVAGQDVYIKDFAATSVQNNRPTSTIYANLSITGTVTSEANGRFIKNNANNTDSSAFISNSTGTGANAMQLINTGGTYEEGIENSTGAYWGATAYDRVIGVPNTRGVSIFMAGIGILGRFAATSFAALNTIAIPAGGTTGTGIKVSSTANFGVFFGSGAPTLSAAKGSLYLRSDGSGTSDRMYVNTNGSTTWTAVTTAA